MPYHHHAAICAFMNTQAWDAIVASSVADHVAAFWDMVEQCGHCLDAPEHVPMGGATPGPLYVPR